MSLKGSEQRRVAVIVASSINEAERAALLAWAQQLLQIRQCSLSNLKKAKAALQLTARSKVVWPAAKIVARELKRLGWDERGTKSRLGLMGAGLGLAVFGGQGAGIAALGTAIGVPLWVVLGAGGAFVGVLIEELSKGNAAAGSKPKEKTSYRVIDAEKED